jgi:putative ABC transport system ATP-binding protein
VLIQLEKITKEYRRGGREKVAALHDIDLVVEAGEMVALMGPSGSGTSTLLNIIGCLDVATKGRYLLDGVDVAHLSKRRLAKLRGRQIGFVFQSFTLIPDVTVGRNVELPLVYARSRRVRRQRANAALSQVGLEGHQDDMPVELFTAQQEKVVIARALINDPPILLDDEPTNDLDAESTNEIMALLTDLSAAGRTVIFCTHEAEVAARAHRVVQLQDGTVVSDHPTGSAPKRRPTHLRAV